MNSEEVNQKRPLHYSLLHYSLSRPSSPQQKLPIPFHPQDGRVHDGENFAPGFAHGVFHASQRCLLGISGPHDAALPDAIKITGTDDHDPPESMITINWIE